MKRFALVCISLVSLLLITSCGGPKSEAEQVTKKFYKALLQGRFDEASSYTASEQAQFYVGIFRMFLSEVDTSELSAANLDKGIRIDSTEQTDDDTIACYVKIAKDKDGKEFGESTQKVVLKKIDGEWKIVSIPMDK
ncbi:DUF4878 domain-containing protein [Porphyromonas uenonis]|uniref:DUF4878 domain-containing protein n=1 Tax=Porphyromonas uenonis TaxID=281920 RepID=UPI0026EF85E9|nr:DUF4878 domain-containing protein [Porphyromonas uenonis]